MLFNSILFLLFFCIVYLLYVSLKHRGQNLLLLVASYLFYGTWDWRFLILIFLTTLVDYTTALKVYHVASPRRRRIYVAISITFNLSILFFFKYFNFFVDSTLSLFHFFGLNPDIVTIKILLPVGISFYTFQSMSYTIDVYRGQLTPTRSLLDYMLFVSFFPQLVAGPIERARELLPQVQAPRCIDHAMVREGLWLILLGYFKKVVIADNMAPIANEVFNNPDAHQGLPVLLGIYAFAFQIYGDFSGYSNIARGVARLMGFHLMVNFATPYFALNPRDFWRRWHISLSTWLRDYLYIPLGGNRKGPVRTYANLSITMLLGGLWHGAAWNFVAWGLYHGLLLILHRLAEHVGFWRSENAALSRPLRLLQIGVMFHLTCLSWVLFRINHLSDFPVLMGNLFTASLDHVSWLWIIILITGPLLIFEIAWRRSDDLLKVKSLPPAARLAIYCLLLGYILLTGKGDGYEFIYFQF
ncbi:MAG TPA: MBOAT family O-acyltransferase [Candidatus Sumerlaeota bacterium]|nr:MBOAT family O-acyltransferase [Candidatus Sumerlaeota bacterium]